jgi:hypothetical protein
MRVIDQRSLIRDRTIAKQGFGRFAGSSRSSNGDAVIFEYPSGVKYRVPLEYMLRWFERRVSAQELSEPTGQLVVTRSRTIAQGDLVRIYLSDDRHYDVAWDTVLMACEPLYEHYGGLTEDSKRLTEE